MADRNLSEIVHEQLRLAMGLIQEGQLAKAEFALLEITNRWPEQADAWHLLGICASQKGAVEVAVSLLGKAVVFAPEVPEFHFNLGNALRQNGQMALAIGAYQRALALRPVFLAAQNALAKMLRDERRFDEAALLFQQMAEFEPTNSDAWINAGETWLIVQEYTRAIDAFQRAAVLCPDNAKIWNNLGVAFSQRGFLQRGLEAFRQATDLDSGYVRALGNYANALRDSGRLQEAMSCFDQAIKQAPEDPLLRSNMLFSSLYSDSIAPDQVLLAHRRFDSEVVQGRGVDASFCKSAHPIGHFPLRIGYLSPDFCDHPVAYFMDGLLANHCRDRVEVFLYHSGPRVDEWSHRLRSRQTHWREVAVLSDDKLRDQVKRDRIDILIDLAGHTAHNRMVAVSGRLAPVQVHYLGYPFSTGVKAIDYRITDKVVDPPGADYLSSESLLRLSRTYYAYTPPADAPGVTPLPMGARGAPTLGVSSNLSKVSSLALQRWAQLLKAIPDARLHWRAKAFDDQDTKGRMLDALACLGVEPARLTLTAWASPAWRRWDFFRNIDMALDTFPYNQATNTCEALWMGVPTLTILGRSHQARMGASIMGAAGLPEFVAEDEQEWVGHGVKLIRSRDKLSVLRSTLRYRLQHSPLLDSAGLAAELEEIYQKIA